MDAMEVVNYASCTEGYPDHNENVYDDMLRGGKKLCCVATDDNHGINTCCGAFTVIKAEKLEYNTVTAALKAGNFYASEGPEITGLWYEDSKVTVECSEAKKIYIVKGIRTADAITAGEKMLTGAEFEIDKDDVYFRIVVVGKDGKKAYTNAYFVDEL